LLSGYAGSMPSMPNPKLFAILSTAVLALTFVLGPVAPALTQDAPPNSAKRGPPTPSLPKTAAERDKALGDLYALLATAEDENAAKAISEGIERIWLHSGSPTVDLLLGRAMKSVAEKKMDHALKLLDSVVEQAPDFTEGWSRRAYVHFQRNQVGQALGDLRRALALDPNHFKSLDGLAQVLREIGQKKAALQVFRHLYEVHPYWPGADKAIDELSREVEGQGI
jgi:tetratricopeptide (TPR) repeat protein